ncbi:MAG: hypothetical protein AAGI90_06075 [Chlamydiota bacterium]
MINVCGQQSSNDQSVFRTAVLDYNDTVKIIVQLLKVFGSKWEAIREFIRFHEYETQGEGENKASVHRMKIKLLSEKGKRQVENYLQNSLKLAEISARNIRHLAQELMNLHKHMKCLEKKIDSLSIECSNVTQSETPHEEVTKTPHEEVTKAPHEEVTKAPHEELKENQLRQRVEKLAVSVSKLPTLNNIAFMRMENSSRETIKCVNLKTKKDLFYVENRYVPETKNFSGLGKYTIFINSNQKVLLSSSFMEECDKNSGETSCDCCF